MKYCEVCGLKVKKLCAKFFKCLMFRTAQSHDLLPKPPVKGDAKSDSKPKN